jgi:hypothetical protein
VTEGWVKIWRKLLKSNVFGHEGLLKLWILCLLKANREEREVWFPGHLTPIKLKPGQFITGRDALHHDYHQGDTNKRYARKAAPVAKTLFRWLEKLEKMQNLSIKKTNKYSIITVVNWSEHQENVQQVSRKMSNKCPQTRSIKKEKNPEKISNEISLSLKRYSDQDLIQKVFQAIASTRRSGKVADSVLLAQLQKWERYPVEQVETGIRIYLDKGHATQGKRENYLLGIIRNEKPAKQPPGTQPENLFKANWY